MVKNNKNVINFDEFDRFEKKKNIAYKLGFENGQSKRANINKCKYNNFLLREKWLQGFEKGKQKNATNY